MLNKFFLVSEQVSISSMIKKDRNYGDRNFPGRNYTKRKFLQTSVWTRFLIILNKIERHQIMLWWCVETYTDKLREVVIVVFWNDCWDRLRSKDECISCSRGFQLAIYESCSTLHNTKTWFKDKNNGTGLGYC